MKIWPDWPRKIFAGILAVFYIFIFTYHFGFTETTEDAKTAPVAAPAEKPTPVSTPISAQPSEILDPEARTILQHEIKSLVEDRRKMVEGGAGSAEIKEITAKIQEKYRKLVPPPAGFPKMSAEMKKVFEQQFNDRKTKIDELMKKYKELSDQKALQAEIDAVAKQINDERSAMQSFIQSTMKPPQASPQPQVATNPTEQH